MPKHFNNKSNQQNETSAWFQEPIEWRTAPPAGPEDEYQPSSDPKRDADDLSGIHLVANRDGLTRILAAMDRNRSAAETWSGLDYENALAFLLSSRSTLDFISIDIRPDPNGVADPLDMFRHAFNRNAIAKQSLSLKNVALPLVAHYVAGATNRDLPSLVRFVCHALEGRAPRRREQTVRNAVVNILYSIERRLSPYLSEARINHPIPLRKHMQMPANITIPSNGKEA